MTLAADLPALVDELQLLRQAAEVATALGGDDHQVLDPYTKLARQVDAGLDRHHFAGLEHVLGALRDARLLVDLDADPVAEPVAEALAVTGGGDPLTGDAVDVLGLDAGRNGLERGFLRLVHGLVDGAGGLAGIAGGKGAGAIGAVAVQLRAHVEDDQLGAADLALARLGVRKGPVGAGGDD